MNPAFGETLELRHSECEEIVRELAEAIPSPRQVARLREEFGAEVAGGLLSVAALQVKARRKFGDGVWWVTERSLQQATPWQVAALKSDWLGDDEVFDFCCGVGGDAMRLALRGPVIGVDLDPLLLAFGAANTRQLAPRATVTWLCRDVSRFSVPKSSCIHIDPDRRRGGVRVSEPDAYQPAWSELRPMLRESKAAVVKLAPAAKLTSEIESSHRCWISLSGQVREQTLLTGAAVDRAGLPAAQRSAIKIRADGSSHRFVPDTNSIGQARRTGTADEAAELGDWLIDPDPAIRAAGLTDAFARQFRISMMAGPSGFLTGRLDDPSAVAPLAIVRPVLWAGPADDRKIRGELKRRDAFPVSVKVRGTGHDPQSLVKRYRKCGGNPVTLWYGRLADRVIVAITESVENEMVF